MFVGIALALRGIYFIADVQAFEELAGVVSQGNTLLAWYIVAAHVVGGACMTLGLGTRVAAVANIPILLGATVLVHSAEGLLSSNQGLELAVLTLVALGLILWNGSGWLSMDQLLRGGESSGVEPS